MRVVKRFHFPGQHTRPAAMCGHCSLAQWHPFLHLQSITIVTVLPNLMSERSFVLPLPVP